VATPTPDPAALRRDLADWRDERDGAVLFDGLAALDRSARRHSVYAHLAEAERRHAAAAEARLRALGVAPPALRPSWRVRALLAWARAFGTVAVLPRVAALEDADVDAYLRRLERGADEAVPVAEERANADALAEFARRESGEAAKRLLLRVRRATIGVVGTALFGTSVLLARNAQTEGLVFGLLTGTIVGPVTHYLLGKLAIPLAAGRVWCGWACWTAALLDQLPYDRPPGWPAPRGPWRTAHLLAVVVGVAVLVLVLGYDRGAVGAHAVVWFVVGNLTYWTWAVMLAVRHRDDRAFCKRACPVAVILCTTSRPALVKLAGDADACAACASRACNAVCPMGVDVAATVLAGARVGGGECIACLQCMAVCPPNALAPSVKLDVAASDRPVLRFDRPPAGRGSAAPQPLR
jgi:ferredoxin